MAMHCKKPQEAPSNPVEAPHSAVMSTVNMPVPNCPEYSVSLREKAGKSYVRVMRDDHPAVRVVIDQATGEIEVTRQVTR